MSEVVAAIEAEPRPRRAALITFDDVPLPFPEELPGERLDAPVTPLDVAVRETIELFRAAGRDGLSSNTHRLDLRGVLARWGRLGILGVGGPQAHTALLREMMVEQEQWLTRARVPGRRRGHEPPPRPRLDAARDLLRPLGGRRSRSDRRRARVHRPRLRADRRAGGALPRPRAERRRPRRVGRRGAAVVVVSRSPGSASRAGSPKSEARCSLRSLVYALAALPDHRLRSARGCSPSCSGAGPSRSRCGSACRRRSSGRRRGEDPGAGLDGVQGRRAQLRRRPRDHPADAARRRARAPLADRAASSATPSRSGS